MASLTGTVILAAVLCAAASRSAAQDPAPAPPAQTTISQQRDISGKQQWSDTAIDLLPGDVVKIQASGTIRRPAAPSCGPDGRLRDWHDLTARFPVNQAGAGALVGQIGVSDKTHPFDIGSRHQIKVQTAGRLYLGVNEASNESSDGSYHVTIEIVRAAIAPVVTASATASASSVIEVPPSSFPSAGLAQIPLRVTNKAGDPGDMVNFVLIGSEGAVDQAFKDAGWLKVLDPNKDHRRAAVGGVFSGFRHKPFVEMPMSQLYLYGRSQDVGYARGTAVGALGSRHHLRLWKAPMQVDGQDVWVGAGTHDKSFMHDPGRRGFSHYIDPNVDSERAYIQQTLAGTHEATQWTMVAPADPIQTAHTVSGQVYHSNGELLVLWLQAPNQGTAAPVIASTDSGSSESADGVTSAAGANAFSKN
jgi:hypothetical protein